MLLYAPDMKNTSIQPEIESKLLVLQNTLLELCDRYLDCSDSVFSIYFYRIASPDHSSIKQIVPVQEGIRDFLSDLFSSAPMRDTEEDLMKIFMTPMIEVLQPLQASVYPITEDGRVFYDDLLKPGIWSVSTVAVRINDLWFILMGEWSD